MIVMEPIGRVRTQRVQAEDDNWGGVESRIVLREDLDPEALLGIEEFSHAEIVFYFDQVEAGKIVLDARHPRNNPDWPRVGIFAQRGKNRPNRIGTTIVRVLGREGRVLRVAELDAIDNTPVLDIKPYVPAFDSRPAAVVPMWIERLMKNYF